MLTCEQIVWQMHIHLGMHYGRCNCRSVKDGQSSFTNLEIEWIHDADRNADRLGGETRK